MIENVPVMLFVKEPRERRYMLINRAGEQLMGLAREEIIGKNDYELLPEAAADIAAAHERDMLGTREKQSASLMKERSPRCNLANAFCQPNESLFSMIKSSGNIFCVAEDISWCSQRRAC